MKGGGTKEGRVQTYVSWLVEGLVPRVFEWHILDRSPQTTTFGMLMEYLHGYRQLDSLDELRPMHLIRTALCGNQPVRPTLRRVRNAIEQASRRRRGGRRDDSA